MYAVLQLIGEGINIRISCSEKMGGIIVEDLNWLAPPDVGRHLILDYDRRLLLWDTQKYINAWDLGKAIEEDIILKLQGENHNLRLAFLKETSDILVEDLNGLSPLVVGRHLVISFVGDLALWNGQKDVQTWPLKMIKK